MTTTIVALPRQDATHADLLCALDALTLRGAVLAT
jgi:hypothetical protein